MHLASELSALFQEAGKQPKYLLLKPVLVIPANDTLQIFQRQSADGKTLFVRLLNYSAREIKVPLKVQIGSKWRLGKADATEATIAPWSAQVVKLPAAN